MTVNVAYRAVLNVTERVIIAPEIGLPMKGRNSWEREWDHRQHESM